MEDAVDVDKWPWFTLIVSHPSLHVGVHWRTATKKDNSCRQRIAEVALVTARINTNGHSMFHFSLSFFLLAFCLR